MKGGQITHTLELDKQSIVIGEEDEITTGGSLYNFHSHPFNAYVMYNVKYGVPSLSDYMAVYTLCRTQNTIVHFVSSLEGLYVISINPQSKICSMPLEKGVEYVKKNFDYPKENLEDLEHYLSFINKKGLFRLTLIKWDEVEDSEMEINFNKVGKKCVIHD